MLKNLIVLLLGFSILSGCTAPGPMQTIPGPVNTPVFEPVALNTVKDGSKKVYFQEFTTMYEDKQLQSWGVFFITDNGAYFAQWNPVSYIYELAFRLPINEIKSISDQEVTREMWFDSSLLVLTDNTDHNIGFALNRKNAARTILADLRTQKKLKHK